MSEDIETLMYPRQIAKRLGMGVNRVNALKDQGCPFIGRKTSISLVRAFLYRSMGAESYVELFAHLPHSNGSISGEQVGKNGSRVASLHSQKGHPDGNE